jgi:hypothetical protein
LVAVVVVAEGAMVGYIEVVVVGALADAVVDSSFDIVELKKKLNFDLSFVFTSILIIFL